jgi:CheY-like chemotaxis protein
MDKKILLIDDQPEILETVEEILENFLDDFSIETAGGVDEALEKCSTEDYALISVDFLMPGKTGIDFVKALRSSDSSNASTPLMILTATAAEVEEKLEGLADVMIVDKSSDIMNLVEIINQKISDGEI